MDGFTLNFSWKRVVCLVALLAIYYFLGGFTRLDTRGTDYSIGQFNRVWSYMMLLYCSGAISITLVDHEIGMFPPTSLRFLYVILGLILMGASVTWLVSTKQAVEKKSMETAALHFEYRQGAL